MRPDHPSLSRHPERSCERAFEVVDSTDVIQSKFVEVRFPGEKDYVTTFDTPGFDPDSAGTAHCEYTDRAGLRVRFDGVLA